MDYDKLSEFFDIYVKEFAPFRDDYLYSQLVSYIKDNILDDSYNNIPTELKKIYGEQEIPESTYNYFLISKGYPEDIVNLLNKDEKKILINILMDFNRYKGTINGLEKLINGFDKKINVYELYLNYGYIGNNSNKEWYFFNKPIIVKKENYKIHKYPYDQIYFSVPNFFIQKEILNDDLNKGKIKIPFKTNLISLDIFEKKEINKKNIILSYLFLHKFQEEILTIRFQEDLEYNIKLIDFIRLWNYCVILKYLPYNHKNFNISKSLIYSNTYSDFDLFLKNIGSNINNNFGDIIETISNYFNNVNDYLSQINLNDSMNSFFSPTVDKNIIFNNDVTQIASFFEDSLVNYINLKYEKNFENLIDSLYNSFIEWGVSNTNDEISNNYSFLLNLINNVNIYQSNNFIHLINFLKPYHAELITNNNNLISLKHSNYLYHTSKIKLQKCYVRNTTVSHLAKFKKIGL